ncbi:MAG: hypothetical protein LBD84_05675 [Campylobacteraceae bacterium]|nr:hypothetical protein [Campylobacteraceae bacterium]
MALVLPEMMKVPNIKTTDDMIASLESKLQQKLHKQIRFHILYLFSYTKETPRTYNFGLGTTVKT